MFIDEDLKARQAEILLDEQLLTIREVARWLKRRYSAVRALIDSHELPALTNGKRTYVRFKYVREYMAKHSSTLKRARPSRTEAAATRRAQKQRSAVQKQANLYREDWLEELM